MIKELISKNRFTHWYTPDGTPAHETDSADGTRKVKVNVTHARKAGLFPSVTSILSLLKKEALEDWKQEQLVKACLTLDRTLSESEHDYVNRVVDHAFSKSEEAKTFGGECHYFMQDVLQKTERAIYDLPEKTMERIREVFTKEMASAVCEKGLVCLEYKYAGRSDCQSTDNAGKTTRWEFKTQGTKPGEPITTYDEWIMQIAAYDFIDPSDYHKAFVVSSTEPGRVDIWTYDAKEKQEAFKAFLGLREVFKFIKKI